MSVLEDLKKPFNLINTIIAVLSLILSIYFYFESVQRREPYFLAQTTSQIVSKTVTSPNFTVVDATGQKVEGNIQVLEISFWNNGRLGIEPQDIRTPVFAEFPLGTRLLGTKVAKENKPLISMVRISEMPPQQGTGPRVALNWSHLDPGMGARIQFIYVGEPNARVVFHGDILDSNIADASGLLKRVANEWVRAGTFFVFVLASIILPDLIKIRLNSSSSRWLRMGIGLLKQIAIWGILLGLGWFLFASKSPPV